MNQSKLLVAAASLALLAACSSSRKVADHPSSTSAGAPVSRSTATSSPPSATLTLAAVGSLSGAWHGSYSGAFTGTFQVQWVEAGGKLAGTITLSGEPAPLPLTGSVSGSSIQFGTVGSQAITYSGSVSGSGMHGQYQLGGGTAGSGPWSATRG